MISYMLISWVTHDLQLVLFPILTPAFCSGAHVLWLARVTSWSRTAAAHQIKSLTKCLKLLGHSKCNYMDQQLYLLEAPCNVWFQMELC